MSFLLTLNQASIILMIISIIYTIYHIVLRIQVKKMQEELVSFIITMIQRKFSDQEILATLHEKGYELEEIQNRLDELKNLTTSFIKEEPKSEAKEETVTKPSQEEKSPQQPAEQPQTNQQNAS